MEKGKSIMRILSICVISLILLSAASAKAETVNGFRDLTWGVKLETMLELDPKLVEGHMGAMPGVKAFKRADDDLMFGGIKAEAISYIFYKGRFTTVSIDFRGYDNYEKLLSYCKKVFGPTTGSAVLRLEQYTSFDSPKTSAMLLYQLSMQTANYGRLYLYSKDQRD
jgi:hypothetical protein